MTEIIFLTDLTDPLAEAARRVQHHYGQGKQVRVLTADAAMTERLDRLLWEKPQEAFLPHTRLDSPLAEQTPILIDHELAHPGAGQVLINLTADPPPFFARFEYLIELVARDAEATRAGRERWKHYKARGFPLRHEKAG